jgi:hypothetical protein
VESEKLLASIGLVVGVVLLVLAGLSVGGFPHNYTLILVELILGIVFVVLVMGTLLPVLAKRPENRRSVTLAFLGIIVTVSGGNLLIFTPVSIIVFQSSWWVFTLTGMLLFIIGIFLIYKYWSYRASLEEQLASVH